MAFGDKLRQGFQNWGKSFRDDKGLFQGGQSGQLGGRFQDFMGGLNDPYKSGQDASSTGYLTPQQPGGEGGYGTDLSRQFGLQDVIPGQGTQTMQNKFMGSDPRLNQDFAGARGQALNIDVSNPNEVREMQQRLIQQGYLPEGADDSIFGAQTEAAMRKLQGHMPMSDPTGMQGLLGYTDMLSGGGGGAALGPDLSQVVNPNNLSDSTAEITALAPGLDYPDVTANFEWK